MAAACATSQHRFTSLVDASGCHFERLAVQEGVAQFSFNGLSPDGRLLAIGWEAGQKRGAYLLNLRTGHREDLPAAIDNAASFSPDGRRILSAVRTPDRRTEILELDRESGATRVYASDPAAEFLPSYSRGMGRIYFNSYRTGGSDLYALEVATGALTRLTHFDGYDAYARLSPDETKVAFHRNVGDGNYEVLVLDLATGQERVLASRPGEDAYPTWSPDGRHIIFSSSRGNAKGRNDLYVMAADGSSIRPLTTDTYAQGAPNGLEVYFVSQREGHGVYRLSLDGGLRCAPRT
jgi:TolB protein